MQQRVAVLRPVWTAPRQDTAASASNDIFNQVVKSYCTNILK